MLGKSNVSAVALQDLSGRFKSSVLDGKLANISDDLSSKDLKNTGMFKQLCAGGLITAEKKFKDPYSFENRAKLIFATNMVPISGHKSPAFYRRWLLI